MPVTEQPLRAPSWRHHAGQVLAAPWLALASAFVFFALNVDLAPALHSHDGQRLAQLVLLALSALLMLRPGGVRAPLQVWQGWPAGMRAALLAALLLGLVSSIRCALPRWALLECLTFLLLILLTLGVAAAWTQPGVRREPLLVAVIHVVALAYGIRSLTAYAAMLLLGPAHGSGSAVAHPLLAIDELFPGFSNVRFFSQIQTLLLPFLLIPAMCWGRTPVQRLLLVVVPALWWMLLVASGTRGTWVAMLAGAVFAAACCGAAGRRWLAWQGLGLACGLVLHALLLVLLPLLMQPDALQSMPSGLTGLRTELATLSGRDALWAAAVALIAEHPLLGIGPMQFAHQVSTIGAHPHNALLQFAVEWGVPAAVLITGAVAAAGLRWLCHLRQQLLSAQPDCGTLVSVALAAAIIGAAVQSQVDGTLVMPVSQVTLALLAGWALGRSLEPRKTGQGIAPGLAADTSKEASGGRSRETPGDTSKVRAQRLEPAPARGRAEGLVMRVLAALSVLGLLAAVAPEVGRLQQRELEHLQSLQPGNGPRLLPRYWTQGWIP